MSDIKVAIVNASSVLTDAQVRVAARALQRQVDEHFAPAWGIDADLSVVPKGKKPPAGSWWLLLVDDSTNAQILGLHDVTSEGMPQSKVFAGSDLKAGHQWTVTASHELLEMLVDPDVQLTTFLQEGPDAGLLYAYEICDPCQSDHFGYRIGDTLVSDFLYPSWWENFRKSDPTAAFDFGGHVGHPFHLLDGGYIDVFRLGANKWAQLMPGPGDPTGLQVNKPVSNPQHRQMGPRRQRRRLPRDQWKKSTPAWTRPTSR